MKSNRRKFLRQFTIGAGSLASLPAFVKKDEEIFFLFFQTNKRSSISICVAMQLQRLKLSGSG
jgi:hypothetical protein